MVKNSTSESIQLQLDLLMGLRDVTRGIIKEKQYL